MIANFIKFLRTIQRCQIPSTILQCVSNETVLAAVGIILRMPSLFIAEIWMKSSPSNIEIPWLLQQRTARNAPKVLTSNGTYDFVVKFSYYLAIMLAFALAFLPIKRLVKLYMHIVAGLLIVASHYCSSVYIEDEQDSGHYGSILEDKDSLQRAGIHVVIQCFISAFIRYLLSNSKLSTLIYVLPVLARVWNYQVEDLHRIHNFAFLFEMIVVTIFFFNNIPKVLDILKSYAQKIYLAMQLYGWMPFFITFWVQVSLPSQFLVFWCGLLSVQFYKFLSVHEFPNDLSSWLIVVLGSMAECIVTPVSLMGICVTISYVSCGILNLTKIFLQGREGLNERGNLMLKGWTEGFTMFLLALQTDLIKMKASQRAFLLSIVLFIVLSSLIQSMYEMTEPVLVGLSAGQSKNVYKHFRAILLSTILWIFPLYMAITICKFFDMDFWLMVVISSCILTSVQVIGALITYSLFLYDALIADQWENLDEVVFYTKSTTRVLEFTVAVFVVCYGLHESLFGQWSWINGMILLIHCYVNVWQRLQNGWKSYLLRREAVKKVASLPDASEEQIRQHNDICAICFQELTSAKVTTCSHFFHATCLRKWLYVQVTCPMCHRAIGDLQESNINNSNRNLVQDVNNEIIIDNEPDNFPIIEDSVEDSDEYETDSDSVVSEEFA